MNENTAADGSPVYVVNAQHGEALHIVHRPDCGMIRHQVEEKGRPGEGPSWRLQEIGRDGDGSAIYRETRVRTDPGVYTADYMTGAELRESGLRYRACRICRPPVADHDGLTPISVKARSLNEGHLGREFIGWGILEGYTVTGTLNEDGTRVVTVDARFEGGIGHRFAPDARLEYLRTTGRKGRG